jgi:hypothetical protein
MWFFLKEEINTSLGTWNVVVGLKVVFLSIPIRKIFLKIFCLYVAKAIYFN